MRALIIECRSSAAQPNLGNLVQTTRLARPLADFDLSGQNGIAPLLASENFRMSFLLTVVEQSESQENHHHCWPHRPIAGLNGTSQFIPRTWANGLVKDARWPCGNTETAC